MKRLALAVTTGALLMSAPAHATNGMRMIGFGPVQDSMGGIGVGLTLDANAVATNPAGLTELGRRLDLGIGYFKPTVTYSATEVSQLPAGGQPGMFVMASGTQLDSGRGGSAIPSLALSLPIGAGFTAGIGAFAVAGMGVDYAQNLYGGGTETSYLQARLAPGIAYKVNDYVSFGLTANAMLAQMQYDVAAGFGQRAHDTSTALGWGVVVGLKVRPTPRLTFGAAWESKSRFQDFSFPVAAHTGVTSQGPMPFPGGTDKLTFHQPQVFTAGLGAQPIDALLVGVDVGWIDWASTNGAGMPAFSSDTTRTGSMPFNLSWTGQWVVKAGAQVAASDHVRLRAGYNYGKNPLDATRAFENVAFPAIAEHHVTAGAGWDVRDDLTVNVAGMFAPKTTLRGANAAEQGIAAYETTMSQWQVDLGIGWKL